VSDREGRAIAGRGVISAARATSAVAAKVTLVPWLSGRKDMDLFSGLLFWEYNKGSLSGQRLRAREGAAP
jgi:hypothetical protein